ncbi:MAG: hypothetical protein ACHP7P_13495 [Terriglobales bacterium]
MPDRYMSGRVVTAGLSSADSYSDPELTIREASVGNGTAGVISEQGAEGQTFDPAGDSH